jgi:hypothetical protein
MNTAEFTAPDTEASEPSAGPETLALAKDVTTTLRTLLAEHDLVEEFLPARPVEAYVARHRDPKKTGKTLPLNPDWEIRENPFYEKHFLALSATQQQGVTMLAYMEDHPGFAYADASGNSLSREDIIVSHNLSTENLPRYSVMKLLRKFQKKGTPALIHRNLSPEQIIGIEAIAAIAAVSDHQNKRVDEILRGELARMKYAL